MKLKKKGVLTREQMAQYLTRLAGMVADGEIVMENARGPLGEEVAFSLEMKAKKGVIEIELAIKARAPQELSRALVQRGVEWTYKRKGRPYKAKLIKKAMGAVWKEFKRMAIGGGAHSPSTITQLLDLMDAYDQYAEDVWKEDWGRCKEDVVSAVHALKTGDREALTHYIEAVDEALKRCHKVYK